jgi:gliding motility-associated lipoprotein GldH
MFPLKKFKGVRSTILYTISFLLIFVSCSPIDVFEKDVTIPKFAWASDFKPEISFEITDSTAPYTIFLVLRHTDAYRYKNIWINVRTIMPGGDTLNRQLPLQLATDEKGWLGSGMGDIWEHRIAITPPQDPKPLRAGTYTFRLENIMREDPLQHVMNVGIRLQKAPR